MCSKSPSNNSSELSFSVCFIAAQRQNELKSGDYKQNALKSGDNKQNEHKFGDNKQTELTCGDYKREARCTRSCQPRAVQGKASKAKGELSLDLLKNCPVVFLRISSLEFFPLDKTFNRALEAKPAIENAMTKKNSLYMVSFSMTVNNKAFQKQCKSIKLPWNHNNELFFGQGHGRGHGICLGHGQGPCYGLGQVKGL